MTTATKDKPATEDAPTSQAIAGWKKRADHLVREEKELVALEDQLEEKLRPVREKFEPDIHAKRAQVAKLRREIEEFGIRNRDILFADGSEISTRTSVISGRRNALAVKVEEGFDEKEVIEALSKSPSTRVFLAVTKRLDRPAIKKVLQAGESAKKVALGVAGLVLRSDFSVSVRGKGD